MRQLTQQEISQLESQNCSAQDWKQVEVAEGFCADYVKDTRFSGLCRLGIFEQEFALPGGLKVHSGIYHATLHNVEVGDNCHLLLKTLMPFWLMGRRHLVTAFACL